MGFGNAQDELINDPTIDGNKLMIVITDGAVHQGDVDYIRREIIKHNLDTKVMFIGVGVMDSYFTEHITDKNIIGQDVANHILLQTISEMLD
jgi:hypothetical protein